MQKWIFTMRPRKPFSMQRKGSFTSVPTYKRNFKLQPSKNKGSYNFGILLFLVIVTSFAIPNWLTQARIHHKEIMTLMTNEDNQAFEFLMTSGKKRLETQNYEGAFSEFKLAKVIKSNNSEVNQLLLKALSILCFEENKYSKELDNLKL